MYIYSSSYIYTLLLLFIFWQNRKIFSRFFQLVGIVLFSRKRRKKKIDKNSFFVLCFEACGRYHFFSLFLLIWLFHSIMMTRFSSFHIFHSLFYGISFFSFHFFSLLCFHFFFLFLIHFFCCFYCEFVYMRKKVITKKKMFFMYLIDVDVFVCRHIYLWAHDNDNCYALGYILRDFFR